MYNKYNLIFFTAIIFLIIIVINYLYNINYKKLEKFNTDSECGDENLFMNNQVQNFCSQICQYPGAGSTPEVKAAAQKKCRLNCPPIARNKLIKGMALGNDYLLKGYYKKTYNQKDEQKKNVENVLSSQVIKNSRLTHILKEDCTQEQLDIILNDMKKDKYGDWIKIGDSPTQYSYDDKVSILCSPDKNYVNTNIEPHFKNSEINDILDQHSIIGLQWYALGNKDEQRIINYISRPDFIEITNSNFIKALSNKIKANKANIPLKFTKTEINQLFDTNAIDILVKNYVIIDNIVYFPFSPQNSRLPVWLYNVKQIAELREKWYKTLNKEISKLDNIVPCTYYKDDIATLRNKITHNEIEWGKIGSDKDQYSLISKYNDAIAAKENAINNCKLTKEKLNSYNPNEFTEDNIIWGKIGSDQNEYSLISKYNDAIAAKENAINDCKYTNESLDSYNPNEFTENNIKWGKIGSDQDEYSLISKYNDAIIAKENAINDCKYTNESLNSLPNKLTEDTVEWGKIGTNEDEYSLISNLKEKENVAKEDCLIPGKLHQDISNLPNELTNPKGERYGKYFVIGPNEKYTTTSYNYPYIDKNNLDNNLSDICFVSKDNMKNDKGELLWGLKEKYGGEYGLIGGWQDFLLDDNPEKEKRYGKIKTSENDGWVGKIGKNTGEYGKIGFTYDNPTGYRWVQFKPKAKELTNNQNIINNQKLSKILNGKKEHIIPKNIFDSLNISSITADSLIKGALENTWYKPRDDIYINSKECDSYNDQLMSIVDEEILSNREKQTLDLTMKYTSDDNTRFVSGGNCPPICTKDSSNTGKCAPCFRKGLITAAASDWSKLVNSINSNNSGLNTLIERCENNLIYSKNGINKNKKLANDFKVLKFKVSNTKPVSGNNIFDRNKDMKTDLMIEKINNNEDIDADTWNLLNINKISPSDYFEYNSKYYVIDNETFLDIIKDYKQTYDQAYKYTKDNIKDCSIAYGSILKRDNTCINKNHKCIDKNMIYNQEVYNSKINDATGENSVWYDKKYKEGLRIAEGKKGKYYPIPGSVPLGEKDATCVPESYTQTVPVGKNYVKPNTCPQGQTCRLPCKECKNETHKCKPKNFNHTKENYDTLKTSKGLVGYNAGKSKFANTYDGEQECVPASYVPRNENGKKRVKIGSDNACTDNAKCHDLPQKDWDNILTSVAREKTTNESICSELSSKVGSVQKTCLKQCEEYGPCKLDLYNVNNVKDLVSS